MDVRVQLLLLVPRLEPGRVNLEVDALGTQSSYWFSNGSLEVLGSDETKIPLERLGEDRVLAEENGDGGDVAIDLELGEAEDARDEAALCLVDPDEEF